MVWRTPTHPGAPGWGGDRVPSRSAEPRLQCRIDGSIHFAQGTACLVTHIMIPNAIGMVFPDKPPAQLLDLWNIGLGAACSQQQGGGVFFEIIEPRREPDRVAVVWIVCRPCQRWKVLARRVSPHRVLHPRLRPRIEQVRAQTLLQHLLEAGLRLVDFRHVRNRTMTNCYTVAPDRSPRPCTAKLGGGYRSRHDCDRASSRRRACDRRGQSDPSQSRLPSPAQCQRMR